MYWLACILPDTHSKNQAILLEWVRNNKMEIYNLYSDLIEWINSIKSGEQLDFTMITPWFLQYIKYRFVSVSIILYKLEYGILEEPFSSIVS